MRKTVEILLACLLFLLLAGCSAVTEEDNSIYAKLGSGASDWSKNYDASVMSLTIAVETATGAEDPIEISDEQTLASVKDALDLIELGDETYEDRSLTRYTLTFDGGESGAMSFVFRADGAFMADDVAYETENSGALFEACALMGGARKAAETEDTQAETEEETVETESDSEEDAEAAEEARLAEVNQELYSYYVSFAASVAAAAGDDLYYCNRGTIGDFDEDGYLEMAAIYTTDGVSVEASILRRRLSDGAVTNDTFEVAKWSEITSCSICSGTYNEFPALIVVSEYHDAEMETETDYIYSQAEGTSTLATTLDYEKYEEGKTSYMVGGLEVRKKEYLPYYHGVKDAVVSFGEAGLGTPLGDIY